MAIEDLADLVASYRRRYDLTQEAALRAVRADLRELAGEAPSRRWGPAPPSPAAVVSQVAEILPQPPLPPPGGTDFARVFPGGRIDPSGWRPPGITPVGFHRGYWTARSGDRLTLYRSGEAVNEWSAPSGERHAQAMEELVAFVKRWPIQAERSVYIRR